MVVAGIVDVEVVAGIVDAGVITGIVVSEVVAAEFEGGIVAVEVFVVVGVDWAYFGYNLWIKFEKSLGKR